MDNESVADFQDDVLIGDYLSRLRKAAWYLPRDRRDWVVAQVGDKVAERLEGADSATPDVRGLLAGLGDPKTVVRLVDGHAPGTEAGWMEFAAVALILTAGVIGGVTGLFDGVGWLLGIVLLWVSVRWRWQDKLLATLVWPGGLLIAKQLMTHYTLGSLLLGSSLFRSSGAMHGRFSVRAPSSFAYVVDTSLGHPAPRHLAVLLLAGAPPALVAIRLLRRARRPEAGPAQLTGPAGELGPR